MNLHKYFFKNKIVFKNLSFVLARKKYSFILQGLRENSCLITKVPRIYKRD